MSREFLLWLLFASQQVVFLLIWKLIDCEDQEITQFRNLFSK